MLQALWRCGQAAGDDVPSKPIGMAKPPTRRCCCESSAFAIATYYHRPTPALRRVTREHQTSLFAFAPKPRRKRVLYLPPASILQETHPFGHLHHFAQNLRELRKPPLRSTLCIHFAISTNANSDINESRGLFRACLRELCKHSTGRSDGRRSDRHLLRHHLDHATTSAAVPPV